MPAGPIEKQLVQVPLAVGIDSKTDPKAVQVGKLIDLQNMRFNVGGALRKRYGYSQQDTSSSVTTGTNLASYYNEIVMPASDPALYSFNSGGATWVNKGICSQSVTTSRQIVASLNNYTIPDSATHGGVTVYAYEWDSGGVASINVTVVNETTGVQTISDLNIAIGASLPRVLFLNGQWYVFYARANAIFYRVLTSASSTTLTAQTQLQATDNNVYDLCLTGSYLALAYVSGGNAVLKLFLQSNFATTVGPVTLLASHPPTEAFSVFYSSAASAIIVAWTYLNTNTFFAWAAYADTTLSTVHAAVSTSLGNSTFTIYNFAYQELSSNTGQLLFDYADSSLSASSAVGNGTYGRALRCYSLTLNAGTTTNVPFTITGFSGTGDCGGVSLVSKIFNNSTSTGYCYFYAVRSSTYQSQLFLYLLNSSTPSAPVLTIIGRALTPVAGAIAASGSPAKRRLPNVTGTGMGNTTPFQFAACSQSHITAANGSAAVTTGVSKISLNTAPTVLPQCVQLGGNLEVAGSAIAVYDGQQVAEHGFLVYPEGSTADGPTFQCSNVSSSTATISCPPGSQIQTNTDWLLVNGTTIVQFAASPNDAIDAVPSGFSNTYTALVSSTDSSSQVAQKIGNILSKTFAPTVTGNQLTLGSQGVPALCGNQAAVWLTGQGTTMAAQVVNIVVPSARHIVSGQYFTIQAVDASNGLHNYYVWFNVASAGGDPAPAGLTGVSVAIANNATAVGVATALKNALNAVQVSAASVFSASQTANQNYITVTNVNHGAAITSPPQNFNVSGALAQSSGGATTVGSYGYAVSYRWEDARGQIHESTPFYMTAQMSSPPDPAKTGGLGSTGGGNVWLTIPTLKQTNKANVSIEIYRTQLNGSTYNRITTPGSIGNSNTADTITYLDSASDVSIAGNDLLYTTGGVVNNVAPPPASIACIHKGRVFLSGLDFNDSLIWVSTPYVSGAPVNFNDTFTIQVDPGGGPITGLASMDDNLIVFKSQKIWVVGGQGPDATGNGSFSLPQPISTPVGCGNANAIVLMPRGLLYATSVVAPQIYLLNRSLQVEYLGAPTEGLLATNSYGNAVAVPGTTEVRFYGSSNIVVYDWYYDQWGYDLLSQAPVVGLIANGSTYYLAGSALYQEGTGFQDPGSAGIATSLTTPWIPVAGVQGLQRIYKLLMLGTFGSMTVPHFTFNIQYDYNTSYSDTITWTPAQSATTPAGQAAALPVQVRIDMPRQLCEAFRLIVTESTPAALQVQINQLALEAGVRPGAYRMGVGSNNYV